MYRDNIQLLTHEDHRFVLNHGALGDAITSLPAIIHARRFAPSMKLTVYVPPWQIDLHRHLLAPYGEFDVRSLEEVPVSHKDRLAEWGDGASTSLNSPAFNTHTRNREHMVDFAFHYLIDACPSSMAERNYPTDAPLGPKTIEGEYIVFPQGATSANKLFKASVMGPVIKWALSQAYRPVLVGTKVVKTHAETGSGERIPITIRQETELLDNDLYSQCLDLREQTTLLELRDILGHAAAVVGVDGGTIHLAGTTDVPIVFATGTTLPRHRYIARHGDHNRKIKYVVPRDLPCAGCQSNWLATRMDFRECAYGDSLCMDLLSPLDMIEGLRELGL